jgi:hypothetical protein
VVVFSSVMTSVVLDWTAEVCEGLARVSRGSREGLVRVSTGEDEMILIAKDDG